MDPYRSAWFMHRLELVLNEAKAQAIAGVKACGSYECKAGQRDGVLCAEGECRDADGVAVVGELKGNGNG